MRIAMFSWETLHSVAVGGIAAHVTELAAALHRKGHDVHVFTRPGYGSGGTYQIEGVWHHYCAFKTNYNFVEEIQDMCRSFVWHFFQEEDRYGRFDVVHAHDWLASNAMVWIKQGRPERAHPRSRTAWDILRGSSDRGKWRAERRADVDV